jgi:hypothetical protein
VVFIFSDDEFPISVPLSLRRECSDQNSSAPPFLVEFSVLSCYGTSLFKRQRTPIDTVVSGQIIVSIVPARQIKCRLSLVRTISFVRLRPLTTFNRPETTVGLIHIQPVSECVCKPHRRLRHTEYSIPSSGSQTLR